MMVLPIPPQSIFTNKQIPPLFSLLFSITAVSDWFVFLLTRIYVTSGSRTTVHLWSGLLPVLFLAWPPSSTQERLIWKWRPCRIQTPSSVIMPILGHLPTKTWPVTPTKCVQVSLWRPLMSLPLDTWAQTTNFAAFRKCGCIELVLIFIFSPLDSTFFDKRVFPLWITHLALTLLNWSNYFAIVTISEWMSQQIYNQWQESFSDLLELRFSHLLSWLYLSQITVCNLLLNNCMD